MLRYGWRKNPVKGENAKQPHLGHFAVPSAIWAFAGDLFVAEHLHRFDFRQRWLGALALQVDVMTALWAREHDSVGFVHGA